VQVNVGGSLTPDDERAALRQAMRLIAAWSSERGELFSVQSSQVINEIFQAGGGQATARLDSLLRTFAALTSTAAEYAKDLSELKDSGQRLDTLERAVERTIEERRRRSF
jgi:hypothetical protein